MGTKDFVKRSIKYIFKGIPENKTYVNITSCTENNLYAGKNILITGGSSGIGYAVAQKCLSGGGSVCITGRKEEKLLAAGKKLGKEKCKTAVFDIGDIENIEKNFYEILGLFHSSLDIVVSNAGIFFEKDFVKYTEEDYENIFNVNLKGAYILSQQVIKHFLENKKTGTLLFVTSERGIMSDTHLYGITKAGLNSLVKRLAKKYAANGIRINAVAPGITATDINFVDPESNLYHAPVTGKRILRAEEIAEVAGFLISDCARCINGEIIACNLGNHIK